MSDFLRNLRSSHKKEHTNSRRNLDGHYYPQTDRRKHPDRRTNSPVNFALVCDSLNETLSQIVNQSARIVDHLEISQEEKAKLVAAEIRRHNAIADFFTNLNRLITDGSTFSEPGRRPPMATTSYTSGTHYTKDDILSIIRNMRKDGATFAIIAEYLKEKGIPTFSGRGDWHAQTIHRLCK